MPIGVARQRRRDNKAQTYRSGPRRNIKFVTALAGGCLLAFASPFVFGRMTTVAHAQLSRIGMPPVCSGGNRAARKLTCIVDGDTGWENGVKWRARSHLPTDDAAMNFLLLVLNRSEKE